MINFFKRKSPAAERPKRRKFRVSRGRSTTPFSLTDKTISFNGVGGVEDDTFSPDCRPISQIIACDLERDRGISRMMERENDYMVRYLTEQDENIIGGVGFRFQSKIFRPGGDYNKPANDRVEAWWREQCRPGNYTVAGKSSGLDETAADKLILRMIVRDGFCLIKFVDNFENSTGFAIQIMAADCVAHTLMDDAPNGNRITNGVEVDEWGRVRAYWLHGSGGAKYQRLDAEDVICPFVKSRPDQLLGMPWARAVAKTLHGLDQYEESVLITAREAACKALFITQNPEIADGDFTEQDLPEVVTAGTTTVLDPGQSIQPYDPTQPTNQYGPFRQGVLMRAASGLNMSYQSLSGDLSGGNFASQRVGLLDEREIWKGRQTWFINAVKVPIFERGLKMALVRQLAGAPLKFEAMNKPNFRGRRWAWVDPQRDIMAAKIGIDNGLTSRAKVISDSDSDLDEEGVLMEIRRGQDIQEDMGLTFPERGVNSEADEEPNNIESIDGQKQA